jgi:putative transposase
MCHLLGVSTTGYYAWLNRPASARAVQNKFLTDRILQIHTNSRGSYGTPRVYEELLAQGVDVGYNCVARLMLLAGLQGISRRRSVQTTRQDPKAKSASDLVNSDFSAQAPNQLWVADITYIPTLTGFVHLAGYFPIQCVCKVE